MDITKIAYEKYRLDWMLQHNYTLIDIMKILRDMQKETPELSIESLFDNWEEYGNGFDGSLWVCYDEFMEAEFLDINYMLSLLNIDQQKIYFKYLKENMEN